MKSVLFTAVAIACLVASSAHASNDMKFEYNTNNPVLKTVAKSHTVKAEFTNTLVGDVKYQIETVVTQSNNSGPVSGQFIGKLTTSIPTNSLITIKPRIEFGENYSSTAAKTGQFYGVEGRVALKTPIEGLTLTTGYRIRKDLGSVVGQNVNRKEVSAEYALNKQYALGLAYYKNTGDTLSNVIGLYTKVKF